MSQPANAGRIDAMARRLRDARGHRVVFLSHCLLNENTRYLGGACRSGCVREVVDACVDRGLGIVQMPCPEAVAWGGVLKRLMLRLYGVRAAGVLAPLAIAVTRAVYRRVASRIAGQVADCLRAGIEVVAVVAVDGSPSCGLRRTMDLRASMEALGGMNPDGVTVARQNELVRRHQRDGEGLFIDELEGALARRGLDVSFVAHDLIAELDRRRIELRLPDGGATGVRQP